MQTVTSDWIIREYKARRGDNPAHFFDADTMRFFQSRMMGHGHLLTAALDNKVLFVTSEKQPDGLMSGTVYPRFYSVRVMDSDGNMSYAPDTEFQGFETRTQAVRYMERLAATSTDVGVLGMGEVSRR